jgi:hypothetical protein
MDPIRLFEESSNNSSDVNAPISLGMDPVRELDLRSKYIRLLSKAKLSGNVPIRLLSFKLSNCKAPLTHTFPFPT